MLNGSATLVVGLAWLGLAWLGLAWLGLARLGSARLGSARRIAPFFQCVKSSFIEFITNQLPKRGVLCLGFGFLRLPGRRWFDDKSLRYGR